MKEQVIADWLEANLGDRVAAQKVPLARHLVQHLFESGFMVVRRSDQDHGIAPPTGSLGVRTS